MSSNTINILIASDIHAGYAEGKPNIENDSFCGLEETLQHATENDVDLMLLGGDLFHESIPTRYAEHKVITLLRKYCLNDKEVAIEMISNPHEVFENSQFKLVNYEDANINIGLPIFSIHGNHDDFSGKGLMALDILHDAGLLNLFGKFNNVENIVVKPVLLKKGDTKIALYGIGSQRDDRLCRAFNAGKVVFCFPDDVDDWFNILVVHQNRPPRNLARTTGAFLPLSVLPSQMNLIIWGHEHKCEIEPQFFEKGAGDPNEGFFIMQPGSTVATSICGDETFPKHVAVLEIKGKTFKAHPIPLQQTRQIIMEDLDLALVQPKPRLSKTKTRTKDMEDEKLIHAKLSEMLDKAKRERGGLQPALPRMRLRVIYSGEWLKIPPAKSKIIGLKYDGLVANPADVIQIKTIRAEKETQDSKGKRRKSDGSGGQKNVGDILKQSFTENHVETQLGLLSLELMEEYVNVTTKLKTNDSKKKRFQLLEECIQNQIGDYKKRIAKLYSRQENTLPQAEDIKRSVERAVQSIKDENREKLQSKDSVPINVVKNEVEDIEDQENSEMVPDSVSRFSDDDD